MILTNGLKDWQIARIMLGKNTQVECKIVKSLRGKQLNVAEDYGGCYEVSVDGEELNWIVFDEIVDK